nr:unnamed protein product [Callosobruchus analis]
MPDMGQRAFGRSQHAIERNRRYRFPSQPGLRFLPALA